MPELSADSQRKVLELKRAYIDSFPEKINQLETCWQNLEQNYFSEDQLSELRKVCHKIAGSSGSFELLEISQAAKSVEELSFANYWKGRDKSDRETELQSQYLILLNILAEKSFWISR